MHRTRRYIIIEVLKLNIVVLICLYNLKMATEELLRRNRYLRYKKILLVSFVVGQVLLITFGSIIYHKVVDEKVSGKMLCREPAFFLSRFICLVVYIILLAVVVDVRKKIDDEHAKRV